MTQSQALEILKTGANVFLTGEPGSGKTHTVNAYISYLKEHGVTPAITASTGIAATHIGGMTIHSWSGIGVRESLSPDELSIVASKQKLIRKLLKTNVLIIDEVSMLSAQAVSMVDAICRAVRHIPEPFGGMQVVVVGDFFQLPPVSKDKSFRPTRDSAENNDIEISADLGELIPNSNYTNKKFAFYSPAWAQARFVTCYLTEQHRQDDKIFLDVLTAIRHNSFDEEHFEQIQTRIVERSAIPAEIPRLFSHNVTVEDLNAKRLKQLPGESRRFQMLSQGRAALVDALKKGCLSPELLDLKLEAVVMFTKNNPGSGFYNGTLGIVRDFDSSGAPVVRTRDGRDIHVEPMDWKFEEGKTRAVINQIPLRLAWAITIHKSQGMSMDAAAVDLSDVFEYGQGYVALSRVRRLSGLHLLGFNRRAFEVHPEILSADNKFRAASEAAEARLSAFSAKELTDKQALFLFRIGGTADPQYVGDSGKVDTYAQTLILWNEGKTISEIVKARALSEGTIIAHIEKLISQGKIELDQLKNFVTPEMRDAMPEIYAVLREFPDQTLSFIFYKLQGKFSYTQIRIARIFYSSEQNVVQ